MSVFNRDVKTKQRNLVAQLPDSRNYDFLREEIAARLAERLDDILDREFPLVLDLGAGSGALLKHLQNRAGIKTIIQTDLSEKTLTRDVELDEKYAVKPIRMVVDEENLPFLPNTFDLVISNLNIHWVNDLPGMMKKVRTILKPDGVFLASMFGENTLMELRSAFVVSETEREGGIRPHISPFTFISDVGNLLTQAGFSLPTIDTERLTIKFADPFLLMKELGLMGEGNANINRVSKNLSSDVLYATAAAYSSLYGNEDGSIPASFQVVYLIGWVPHPSQPQPKRRGSANASLGQISEKLGKL